MLELCPARVCSVSGSDDGLFCRLSPTCALPRGSLSGKPDDWPQDMKEYVERCFTACESEEDKDRTEKLLKELLQARLQDGSAYTIDWSREPLPGLVQAGDGEEGDSGC